jgi:hypothetical protein
LRASGYAVGGTSKGHSGCFPTGFRGSVVSRRDEEIAMPIEAFEELMVTLLVGALVSFMAFIVWDLAKTSNAGRFGTFILFFVLGLGVLGFLIKTLVIAGLEGI